MTPENVYPSRNSLWRSYFPGEWSSSSSNANILNVAHAVIENTPKPIPPGALKLKYRTLAKIAIEEVSEGVSSTQSRTSANHTRQLEIKKSQPTLRSRLIAVWSAISEYRIQKKMEKT